MPAAGKAIAMHFGRQGWHGASKNSGAGSTSW
jgi:hypothetical protein